MTSFNAFTQASFRTSFSVAALLLRLVMGGLFFYAGWSKLVSPDGWSAAGYLSNATGPFSELFLSLAGNPVVDLLNVWGLLLIGVALFIGLLVRTASVFGIFIMFLYYISDFAGNTAHGYIDDHIVYIFIFLLFFFGGFGHVWGLDSFIERRLGSKKNWLKIFFG